MRLDKFISTNTPYSRSEVKKLIKAECVKINGVIATKHDNKIEEKTDIVTLDGEQITAIGDIYILLNKPPGYVCANCDSEHPTVLDLLRDEGNFIGDLAFPLPFEDLQIVGRLDIDTTGMVLLTNNGQWNHCLTSPNGEHKKVYLVTLERPLNPKVAELFADGIQLDGEKKKTRPAFLDPITDKNVRLSLAEGKYHQVKRMFAATGNHVTSLHREAIGGVKLDENLQPGQYRFLNREELAVFDKNTADDKF